MKMPQIRTTIKKKSHKRPKCHLLKTSLFKSKTYLMCIHLPNNKTIATKTEDFKPFKKIQIYLISMKEVIEIFKNKLFIFKSN